MDFFDHQDAARRLTRRLIVLFGLSVAAIVVAVYCCYRLLLVPSGARGWPFWDLDQFLLVAALTLLAIAAGSLFKMALLRDGGEVVARQLGGEPISPDTEDPAERRLLNVVEEMAIAAGTPVPTVYLLEREPGINAFAAGRSSDDAVIGVTDGCLRLLDRDQLQGVIAHEFSHVLNGDMRLNLRLIGWLYGILVLSLIGRTLLHGGRLPGTERRRIGGSFLFGAALVALGWLGVFFGRLIQSAVSRQREYLADASAVQFTRNPDGVAGALRKIGGLSRGSRLRTSGAQEAAHLFFGDAVKSGFFGWLSTHPPLDERIRRIDPSFDGVYPEVEVPAPPRPEPAREPASAPPVVPAATEMTSPAAVAVLAALDPHSLTDRVGTLDREHLAYAARLREQLPAEVTGAARRRAGAEALVQALLLDADPAVRERQLAAVERVAGAEARQRTAELHGLLEDCPESAFLPLVDLALPALRRLSASRHRAFEERVRRLVSADRKVSLREYVLQWVLRRHLARHFGEDQPPTIQYYSLRRLDGDCAALLSALARTGHGDGEEAAEAFAAGAAELADLDLAPDPEVGLQAVDGALGRLAQVAPRLKRKVLRAAVATVVHDRRVTVREGELLRAVAEALDCPMPPFLPGQEVGKLMTQGNS